jgi:hypothetical protein
VQCVVEKAASFLPVGTFAWRVALAEKRFSSQSELEIVRLFFYYAYGKI